MKQIKIVRLTEKDIIIPYDKIVRIEGGRNTRSFMITYVDDKHVVEPGKKALFKQWCMYEGTMSWARIADDGTETSITLTTEDDFDEMMDYINGIIKQNEVSKAIDSL